MFSSAGVKVQKTEAKTESEDYDVVRFRCKGKALTRDGQAQLAALVRARARARAPSDWRCARRAAVASSSAAAARQVRGELTLSGCVTGATLTLLHSVAQ